MKFKIFLSLICAVIISAFFLLPVYVDAQPGVYTKENLIQYTSEWKGERFPDGRPKVPDDIIERMKLTTIEEAWSTLMREGYRDQFESGWEKIHQDVVICGRALTVNFMPARPDVDKAVNAQGVKDNRNRGQYTWGINMLQKDDVYVADVYGKLIHSSHVGDNLGTAIFTRSGNGAIINGTVRDLEGLEGIEGFNVFVREFNPESHKDMTLMGINCPVRIGRVTVMPGDVVLAKREGVIFIPPHLAERVVINSERTRLRDMFAHQGVREGRFTAGEADGGFTEQMNKDFNQWLKDNIDSLPPPRKSIEDYIKQRESGKR